MPTLPSPAKFRLTASAIASHYKHRCDRLFRWNAVATADRGKAGIGWNVPRRARDHSRPGIALLMTAGDEFEIGQVQALEAEVQNTPQISGVTPVVYHAGIETERGRQRVAILPLQDAIALLQQPVPPRFIAQIEINLVGYPEIEAHFLQRFGLDPAAVELGVCRPDLIEVVPPDHDHPVFRLRVWDFKGSQIARHEHFIQVAFYGMLLESVLVGFGITNVMVDTEQGVVESRKERKPFELAPYRLALADFLQNRVPELLNTPAADTHYHVNEGCVLCEYMEECRSNADAGYDLSRIPYITSESKRHLRAAGYRSHQDLVALDPTTHQAEIAQIRGLSHDLSANVTRYIAAAQALEDGTPRLLEKSTFQMPQYEGVRVVLCAEQDAVTGTCFALGIKTFEWNSTLDLPAGEEHVFIVAEKGDEVSILLPFLQTLNRLLERVDQENQVLRAQSIDTAPEVIAADQLVVAEQTSLEDFKTRHASDMRKHNPQAAILRAQRDGLQQVVDTAKRAAKDARSAAAYAQRRAMRQLHFYIYDTLDLLALRSLVERHLFDAEPPELLIEISNLTRIFPPESVLPDAETFRTIPATVVVQMLRTLVALPVAYGYDLRRVSEHYQPAKSSFQFRTPYGFSWEHSNQIAFERIHDVWNGAEFRYQSRGTPRVLGPAEILEQIDKSVRAKLRATNSVVRKLKEDLKGQLLLRKEPFRLFTGAERLHDPQLEALRIFTSLEVSLAELDVKRTHTLPVSDRVANFVCIHGLQALSATLDADNALWFTFNSVAADTKFEPGDFNLVLTPADDPSILLSEIDGQLFNSTSSSLWRYAPYKVSFLECDLHASPPRVRLAPDKPAQFLKTFDPTRTYVLDHLFVDYNSTKVFDVLQRLSSSNGEADHIQSLLATATADSWTPFITDTTSLEADFRACLTNANTNPDALLNPSQWQAWRGVFREPLTLVWGPPGTGKTHTIAHILIGNILAARRLNCPIRVLVTAFTHHAINNVLKKVADLANHYQISMDDVQIAKMQRGAAPLSDATLPKRITAVDTEGFTGTLENAVPCQIVGATVWAVHRAMKAAGDVLQPWFDVVLVDEASQLKLPDALIAFSASKPGASIILAGDDRQLPPIIHGAYPEEYEYLLSSVFAFVRGRIDQQQEARPDLEQRILFQLEDNFRMNDVLTAYPRDVLYKGRFFSTKPDIRISTAVPIASVTDDLLEFLLHPDRPVLLVRYRAPRSFTARNPLEAELAARFVDRLRAILIDGSTGAIYTPEGLQQEGVAILSPHRAQNSTIRQILGTYGFGTAAQPMPLVDTVDKLQGQERDVVIVSYGVADGEYAEGEAEFLLSSNRFNVAATRARHKLIVLCADTVLDVVPTDQQVLLDAMMLKEFRCYCNSGARPMDWTPSAGDTVTFHVQWKEFPQ